MKKIAVFAVTALLSGCAMTYDIVQVGPERYQVAAMAALARGGIAGAQTHAMEAAGKKCTALGKSVSVINVETGHDFPANGRAVVIFECRWRTYVPSLYGYC